MTGLRVGTIMLGVTDLDRSVAFYRDTLGLALRDRTDQFAFLDGRGVTLGLSVPHAGLRTPPAGAVEIVFAVAGVREDHQTLAARGVAFLNQPRPVRGDEWAANFRDPDGHLLSIFGPERRA